MEIIWIMKGCRKSVNISPYDIDETLWSNAMAFCIYKYIILSKIIFQHFIMECLYSLFGKMQVGAAPHYATFSDFTLPEHPG
jgi:hypothetical protein